jgi:hypothetical protein
MDDEDTAEGRDLANDQAKARPDDETKLSDEDAKRQALRKRKPLGDVVKPLTKEQIEALLGDPEVRERDNLADALPKGWDADYQDEF